MALNLEITNNVRNWFAGWDDEPKTAQQCAAAIARIDAELPELRKTVEHETEKDDRRALSNPRVAGSAALEEAKRVVERTERKRRKLITLLGVLRSEEAAAALTAKRNHASALGVDFHEETIALDEDLRRVTDRCAVVFAKYRAFVAAALNLGVENWDSAAFDLNGAVGHTLSVLSQGTIGSPVGGNQWMELRDEGHGSVAAQGQKLVRYALSSPTGAHADKEENHHAVK